MRGSSAVLVRRTAVGLSCLSALAAQADTSPRPGARAAIATVLAELDAAFARGDAAAYARRFAPDDAAAHAVLVRRLEQVFADTTQRHRQSTVVGTPWQVGGHSVVRVRCEVDLQGGARCLLPRTTFVEEYVLALRPDAAGKLTPTLVVEAAAETGCVRDDRFRCPPCNFEIGGVAGWLCVPQRGDRAAALEAASFHLLGSDVACHVAVQVEPEAQDPMVVAQQLADTLHALQPGSSIGVRSAWLPPAHAGAPPTGLRGASVTVDLPADRRTIFHVAAFGGLQHLLLLRGSVAALRRHDGEVHALLASYRLLEPDRDAASAATASLRHHTGGTLDGATYRNARFGVELEGAPGWRPALFSGGPAFRVMWTSPRQSHLWLYGYLVPPGMTRWCRATALRWLEQQCEQRHVDLLPDAPDSTGWLDTDCGATRTLLGNPRQTEGPDTPRRRWFRLLVRDDLLLVVDGFATTSDDEQALQAMLRAVRRS